MKNKRLKNTEGLSFHLLVMANFKTNTFGEDRSVLRKKQLAITGIRIRSRCCVYLENAYS